MNQDSLNKILSAAIDRGVSDVHFQVGYPPLFRLHGELLEVKFRDLEPSDTRSIAELICKSKNIPFEYAKFEEIDTSYGIPDVGRFRANIFKQRGTIGVVLRAIPIDIKDFEKLHLPEVLKTISNMRRGLVLVTGATGMGKSTTLAAMIEHINKHRKAHVITIEDPIEFLFRHNMSVISQREIGYDTSGFSVAMRAALRQDPDVIMVGELRDHETADICLKAAETGHLVLSSIHTTSVPKTISRFMGFFPPEDHENIRLRLADNLMAVISLRLLISTTGTGLIPCVEILRTNRTVQEYIRDAAKIEQIREYIAKNREFGMQTFDQHLVDLYKQEKITKAVAKAAASSPDEFERAVTFES